MDSREPAWILTKELPEVGGDRTLVDQLLAGLEARGLVDHTWEPSGDPGADDAMTPSEWWGLTDAGWALLGARPSSGYG